ncbi:LytR/AlgR family response regulator transcription factor [Flagellimonas sp.]|uniref:LytR/AlgR family response regulator transcription factor n=1 Tax=Flagellimonas sp. TaxID=2058762 RepID=UPI003BAD6A0E
MKKLSVAVVDDEGPALRRVVKMVNEHPLLELMGTAMTAGDAIRIISETKPDLLLLDIQLKDATAFDVLENLGKDTFKGKIIFITAYDHYAIKAFELRALDYLMKPFKSDRFHEAIERVVGNDKAEFHKVKDVMQGLKWSSTELVVVPEGIKNYFLNRNSIQYIYAEGYYANFVMDRDKKLLRISLKKLESLLPQTFIRVNKSAIVNYHRISELVNNKSTIKLIMEDGNEFQVSDAFSHGFKKMMHELLHTY